MLELQELEEVFQVNGNENSKERLDQFPFYKTSDPMSFIGFNYDKLGESEKNEVDLLEKIFVMSVRNLMETDENPMGLKYFIL